MEEGEPACLICLERTEQMKPELLSCACSFRIHTACWIEFVRVKGALECPICHLVIQETRRQRRQRQRRERAYTEEIDDGLQDTRRCVAGCLVCVMVWCLSLIVIRAAGVPV
jgi:hypothetical protein